MWVYSKFSGFPTQGKTCIMLIWGSGDVLAEHNNISLPHMSMYVVCYKHMYVPNDDVCDKPWLYFIWPNASHISQWCRKPSSNIVFLYIVLLVLKINVQPWMKMCERRSEARINFTITVVCKIKKEFICLNATWFTIMHCDNLWLTYCSPLLYYLSINLHVKDKLTFFLNHFTLIVWHICNI